MPGTDVRATVLLLHSTVTAYTAPGPLHACLARFWLLHTNAANVKLGFHVHLQSLCRLLQRLFKHVDCPLVALVFRQQTTMRQQQQQQQSLAAAGAESQELLALASLRALQLHPKLGLSWRGALWFKLLNHPLPLVRWVTVRGITLLLGLSDAMQQQLMAQQLTVEELVAAQLR